MFLLTITYDIKILDALTLLVAIIGGVFALVQWNYQLKHKRVEIVNEQLNIVRDDKK